MCNSAISSKPQRSSSTTLGVIGCVLLVMVAICHAGSIENTFQRSSRTMSKSSQHASARQHRLLLAPLALPSSPPAAAAVGLKAPASPAPAAAAHAADDSDVGGGKEEEEGEEGLPDLENKEQTHDQDEEDTTPAPPPPPRPSPPPPPPPPPASPSQADAMKQLTACPSVASGGNKNQQQQESVLKCEPAAACKQAGVAKAPACVPAGTCAKLCQLAGNSCKQERRYLYDLPPGLLPDADQQDAVVVWWTASQGPVSMSCSAAGGMTYGEQFVFVGPALCPMPLRGLPGLAEGFMLCLPSKAQPGLCASQGITPSSEAQCVAASSEARPGIDFWKIGSNRSPVATWDFEACKQLCAAAGAACQRDLQGFEPAGLKSGATSFFNSAKDAKTGELLFNCTSRLVQSVSSTAPAIMDSAALWVDPSKPQPPAPPPARVPAPPRVARPGRRGRGKAAAPTG